MITRARKEIVNALVSKLQSRPKSYYFRFTIDVLTIRQKIVNELKTKAI